MEEIWKDIDGYENKYQISNFGRLRSINYGIIKPMVATNGYLIACLWKNNKQKKFLIHRLVAKAFIENPLNLKEINHKDENKRNNCVDNLEWCDHYYNINYGSTREKISNSNKGKLISKESKEKISKISHNSKWVNNGIEERFIQKEKIQDLLNKGYVLGRI